MSCQRCSSGMVVPFLFLAYLCAGCTSVKSDLCYQKGSTSFYRGDYSSALRHLHDAIALDPTMGKNYYLLACTHHRIGQTQLAWENIRRSLHLDRHSQEALQLFVKVYGELDQQYRFSQHRVPAAELIDLIGVADEYIHDVEGNLQAIYYGPLCLHFKNGALAESEWVHEKFCH